MVIDFICKMGGIKKRVICKSCEEHLVRRELRVYVKGKEIRCLCFKSCNKCGKIREFKKGLDKIKCKLEELINCVDELIMETKDGENIGNDHTKFINELEDIKERMGDTIEEPKEFEDVSLDRNDVAFLYNLKNKYLKEKKLPPFCEVETNIQIEE